MNAKVREGQCYHGSCELIRGPGGRARIDTKGVSGARSETNWDRMPQAKGRKCGLTTFEKIVGLSELRTGKPRKQHRTDETV